ncbi:hypothetical protein QE152_g38509 [Popillia japonica]|uniref:Uncharacterized protein n=1 Tax=Popillia japonica TaxID=7064 RepID=A0AAW1HWB1_POPJA
MAESVARTLSFPTLYERCIEDHRQRINRNGGIRSANSIVSNSLREPCRDIMVKEAVKLKTSKLNFPFYCSIFGAYTSCDVRAPLKYRYKSLLIEDAVVSHRRKQ